MGSGSMKRCRSYSTSVVIKISYNDQCRNERFVVMISEVRGVCTNTDSAPRKERSGRAGGGFRSVRLGNREMRLLLNLLIFALGIGIGHY